jgi:hypothetical protein
MQAGLAASHTAGAEQASLIKRQDLLPSPLGWLGVRGAARQARQGLSLRLRLQGRGQQAAPKAQQQLPCGGTL